MCVQSEGIVGGTQVPPLVGNKAPDFSAQAVYDQEFIDITLSQYRVGIPMSHHPPPPSLSSARTCVNAHLATSCTCRNRYTVPDSSQLCSFCVWGVSCEAL